MVPFFSPLDLDLIKFILKSITHEVFLKNIILQFWLYKHNFDKSILTFKIGTIDFKVLNDILIGTYFISSYVNESGSVLFCINTLPLHINPVSVPWSYSLVLNNSKKA